jgi:peptidyl-prolyl cis-trans isomerase B (cyclophilin B)
MKKHIFNLSLFLLFTTQTACVQSAPTPAASAPPATEAKTSSATSNRVKMQTSQGTLVIELDPSKAPKTVENFLRYVKEGFYEGTIFHRVIDNFMIQGGGLTKELKNKQAHEPIPNEASNGLKNLRGTVTMARTGNPHSAASQFFVNLKDNGFLDYTSSTPEGFGYAVFGKVVEGMEVVDKIAKAATGTQDVHENVPNTPIVIEKVSIVETVPAKATDKKDPATKEEKGGTTKGISP